ncbi:MAG: hypothetical protein H0V03_10695 [Thermoleophilaceae bacterium]|nr:hypothetical protein [Thermoleophilaceae bacterium]
MSSASAQLPHWPPGTAAVLCVAGPHAIPVSTAIRAGDDRLVFALGRRRDALARLREDPRAALCMLAEGLAFTAHGEISVLREELERIPLAALELRVERVQDHLADGRTDMLGAAGWRWRGERDAEADRIVHEELAALAAMTG